MMKNIAITTFLIITIYSCKAQLPPGEYTSRNKKAIAFFEAALKYYNARNDVKAKEELLKAIEKDDQFIEPHLLMAEMYNASGNAPLAIDEYKKALTINPKFNINSYFNLAELEIRTGNYADAKMDYEQFLKKPHINPNTREIAETQLDNCNFALNAISNPVPFEPKNLGEAINSPLDEYFPAVTADDQTFLYTRNNRTSEVPLQEDFLISKKISGNWASATLIGSGINTAGNEGAPCLSADGQLLFFVACALVDGTYTGNRKGYGACDIFYSQKVGTAWAKPYNIGKGINTSYWETQPSFSSDGKTLYFVSNRPGGVGESDIWYATLKEDGTWGAPVNIGKNINTPFREESIFIHPDGQTLYFGSNGHVGMGGFDIYMSRKDADGKWGPAINLGYPINTYADEQSLLVNGSGSLAYFASSRPGGLGGLDLYQFDLYEAARPQQITYMKGKVYDAFTKLAVGAHFELIDLETSKTIITSDANSGNGEFLVTLPINKNYALNVTHPGYLFYSENFSLKNLIDKTKPYLMDVPLQHIDTGSVVELKNVFFETAKFDLKPESKIELDKLVTFLTLNKTMHIELLGHTDNVGDKKQNQLLSENRAKAVYDYLVLNNIDAGRLTYKGYGDTQPKVKNDSDENRAKNRRTEFKVISK